MEGQYCDDHSNFNFKGMMPTAISSFFSAYAPFAGYMFMLKSMNTNFLPYEFKSYIYSYLQSSLSYLLDPLANHITLLIDNPRDHYSDEISQRNLVYDAAEVYLATKINPKTQIFRISKAPKQKVPIIVVTTTQEIADTFENIQVKWRMIFPEEKDRHSHYSRLNKSRFELTFHRKHKDKVINSYIPYVLARAEAIKDAEKTLKLYSYNSKRSSAHYFKPSGGRSQGSDDDDDFAPSSGNWSCADNEHPATFETIAMEPELKRIIIDDLEKFVKRREFYKRVGKAWKRGYLLFGPPGTGKSSLVAAMANHLRFDIYDLELTSISSNDQLRKALMSTTNRSIVVFEDIDCSKESVNRESAESKNFMVSKAESKFTLSGLLNVVDGLWSSCGDERIIVFTTNHKERLDPALLRPGRMDVHIHMSYCTPRGFKTLASNYLGIQDTSEHRLCGEIEALMENTNITPAEVCEELMRGDGDDADAALEGLVNCLKCKRLETKKIEEENKEAKRQKTDNNASEISENW
ncbi:AAA-ATPase At2g18193-like [Rosa rugosa]|uniref:AAA-ATPase At2g18193-like n=1 Tax=Rosa rugosa TaxID=74645 RepID=UPI002B41010F|nr:AAA-ATPase At2g18193-like [Rosa rugosa]